MIVGTSAGGIVALGLGIEGLPVGGCLQMTRDIAKETFQKRRLTHKLLGMALYNMIWREPPYELKYMVSALGKHINPESLLASSNSPLAVNMNIHPSPSS